MPRKIKNYTINECFQYLIIMLKSFGSFPLQTWQFSWFSFKMLYTVFLSLGYLICGLLALRKCLITGNFVEQLS